MVKLVILYRAQFDTILINPILRNFKHGDFLGCSNPHMLSTASRVVDQQYAIVARNFSRIIAKGAPVADIVAVRWKLLEHPLNHRAWNLVHYKHIVAIRADQRRDFCVTLAADRAR